MMKQVLNEIRVAIVALALLTVPSFGFWMAGAMVPDLSGSSMFRLVRPATHAGRAVPRRGGGARHRSGNIHGGQLQ
jgi:hypothetical protein